MRGVQDEKNSGGDAGLQIFLDFPLFVDLRLTLILPYGCTHFHMCEEEQETTGGQ